MASDEDLEERLDDLARLAHRVAFRILGDPEDARDVAQETLARAFARWRSVRDHAEAWVARVAANQALDLMRHRGRRHRIDLPDSAGGTDPGSTAALRDEVVALLRALPRRQRQVVVLRYLADLPEAEVADLLGCSVGTVKRHAHRALAALRSAADMPAADALAPANPPMPGEEVL